jgi:hypothetical protein
MQGNMTKITAIINKPLATANSVTSTTTTSQRARLRTKLHNIAKNRLTEKAQALADIQQSDDTSDMQQHVELANNIFDPETGQPLTYRKLIKHPKYKDIWKNQLQTNLGGSHKGWEIAFMEQIP